MSLAEKRSAERQSCEASEVQGVCLGVASGLSRDGVGGSSTSGAMRQSGGGGGEQGASVGHRVPTSRPEQASAVVTDARRACCPISPPFPCVGN